MSCPSEKLEPMVEPQEWTVRHSRTSRSTVLDSTETQDLTNLLISSKTIIVGVTCKVLSGDNKVLAEAQPARLYLSLRNPRESDNDIP